MCTNTVAVLNVLVASSGTEEAMEDVAMCCFKPVVVRAEDMPQSLLDSENLLSTSTESGKDPAIMEKMVEGREEVC